MSNAVQFSNLQHYQIYLQKRLEENINIKKYDDFLRFHQSDEDIKTFCEDENLSNKEFIEIIALRRLSNYDVTSGGANEIAEKYTDELYQKYPYKFVEEFLQNADDCNYTETPEITIIINEKTDSNPTVEFVYNEEGFTKNDVYSLTYFSKSTKQNSFVKNLKEDGVFYREKTGRKGIGFKSVFSLLAENVIIHIRSNGFSFKLDNEMGRIMPVWEDDDARMDGLTHVIVEIVNPAPNGIKVKEIYPRFKRLFCMEKKEGVFASSPFLFMHRLRSVHIQKIDDIRIEEFWTEYQENNAEYYHQLPKSDKQVYSGIANNGHYYKECLQQGTIYTYYNDETDEIPIVRFTRMVEHDEGFHNYSVIAPIIKADTVCKWETGSLFRTFPMYTHTFSMPLSIDAPFILNSDRSSIEYSPEGDEGQTIYGVAANIYNSKVSENLFRNGGVLEAFFLRLRELRDIQADKYFSQKRIVLFTSDNNKIDGGFSVPTVNLSSKCREYPVFRLLDNRDDFVSADEAVKVSVDLFTWPNREDLFRLMIGNDYKKYLISDIYNGSSIVMEKDLISESFVESLNTYLNCVESNTGIESRDFIEFLNHRLYPYLLDKRQRICEIDNDAFAKMNIYISRVQMNKGVKYVRESMKDNTRWLHDDRQSPANSINRYRIVESSPADMTLLQDVIDSVIGPVKLSTYFDVQSSKYTRQCKDWDSIRDYIEAAMYYGFTVKNMTFSNLSNYALSKTYAPEFNAFRETGIVETIDDKDIQSISRYFSNNTGAAAKALKGMGLKKNNDFFSVNGAYLEFKSQTLELLRAENLTAKALEALKAAKNSDKRKINASYDDLKKCAISTLLFLMDERNQLFPEDSLTQICNEIQNVEEYWKKVDVHNVEAQSLILRALAGSDQGVTLKKKRSILIKLSDVLEQHLEDAIETVLYEKSIESLTILNADLFEEIPQEEIKPIIIQIAKSKYDDTVRFYKGSLTKYGGNKQFIKDFSGHIYLHADNSGKYIPALEAYINKKIDAETLKYFEEVEEKTKQVKEELIDPLMKKYGNKPSRVYVELERRFDQFSEEQIINILAWFRNQSYSSAFGNGNISSQKRIEDDFYNYPWKFVYEFIQNVDDCAFGERKPALDIIVSQKNNQIIFDYNENGFTLSDIKALTQFGASNKVGAFEDRKKDNGLFDNEKTGQK